MLAGTKNKHVVRASASKALSATTQIAIISVGEVNVFGFMI